MKTKEEKQMRKKRAEKIKMKERNWHDDTMISKI